MKLYRRAAIAAASLAFVFATPLAAQNFPMVPGEYVEVGSISIDDGHDLDYANFLAGQWRGRQEFAKGYRMIFVDGPPPESETGKIGRASCRERVSSPV